MFRKEYNTKFSGVGGFELGIKQSYVDITNRNEDSRSEKNTKSYAQKGNRLVTKKGKGTCAKERQPLTMKISELLPIEIQKGMF